MQFRAERDHVKAFNPQILLVLDLVYQQNTSEQDVYFLMILVSNA